jgi:lipopolysaccharide transport system ATP-binding protein
VLNLVRRLLGGSRAPTIFQVTHWKAGSQWIYQILLRAAGDRVVAAEGQRAHVLNRPLRPGKVYPTCYLTRQELLALKLPRPWQCFVVIRDLRDTLVSQYFSARYSHRLMGQVGQTRELLEPLGVEDGLLALLEAGKLDPSAAIQRSWLESAEPLIKYEDLLSRDEEILVPLLTERCSLGVPAEQVREAVRACRFENLTKGRARGQEDVHAHQRKGVAGDWRNHFTDRVTKAVKQRYGELLVATGYEKDLNWSAG